MKINNDSVKISEEKSESPKQPVLKNRVFVWDIDNTLVEFAAKGIVYVGGSVHRWKFFFEGLKLAGLYQGYHTHFGLATFKCINEYYGRKAGISKIPIIQYSTYMQNQIGARFHENPGDELSRHVISQEGIGEYLDSKLIYFTQRQHKSKALELIADWLEITDPKSVIMVDDNKCSVIDEVTSHNYQGLLIEPEMYDALMTPKQREEAVIRWQIGALEEFGAPAFSQLSLLHSLGALKEEDKQIYNIYLEIGKSAKELEAGASVSKSKTPLQIKAEDFKIKTSDIPSLLPTQDFRQHGVALPPIETDSFLLDDDERPSDGWLMVEASSSPSPRFQKVTSDLDKDSKSISYLSLPSIPRVPPGLDFLLFDEDESDNVEAKGLNDEDAGPAPYQNRVFPSLFEDRPHPVIIGKPELQLLHRLNGVLNKFLNVDTSDKVIASYLLTVHAYSKFCSQVARFIKSNDVNLKKKPKPLRSLVFHEACNKNSLRYEMAQAIQAAKTDLTSLEADFKLISTADRVLKL